MLDCIKIQIFVCNMDIIFSIAIILIVLVAIVNTVYSYRYKVVNMPSSRGTRRAVIHDIRNHVDKNDTITVSELGAGWGGLAVQLTKNFPFATVKSYEISPFPFLISIIRRLFMRTSNYHLIRADFFKSDFSDSDILMCYLSPYHMRRIEKEILPSLKKGALIYSQGFEIEGLEGDIIFSNAMGIEKKLYRYQKI